MRGLIKDIIAVMVGILVVLISSIYMEINGTYKLMTLVYVISASTLVQCGIIIKKYCSKKETK